MVVDFVAVTMAFAHRIRLIYLICERIGPQRARLRAKTHGAAEIRCRVAFFNFAVAVLPFGNECDHGMRGFRIELG